MSTRAGEYAGVGSAAAGSGTVWGAGWGAGLGAGSGAASGDGSGRLRGVSSTTSASGVDFFFDLEAGFLSGLEVCLDMGHLTDRIAR
jgi:hypothetical protein